MPRVVEENTRDRKTRPGNDNEEKREKNKQKARVMQAKGERKVPYPLVARLELEDCAGVVDALIVQGAAAWARSGKGAGVGQRLR